jgi:hypothetical protein
MSAGFGYPFLAALVVVAVILLVRYRRNRIPRPGYIEIPRKRR